MEEIKDKLIRVCGKSLLVGLGVGRRSGKSE